MDLTIRNKKRSTLAALTLSTALLAPAAMLAQEVTLKSADGTVNLVGDFIEFTDNNYVIRTGLGDLRISAARVRCEGAACPDFGTTEADIAIGGSDVIGDGVMPLLLSGYAANLGAEATVTTTGQAGQILAELVGEEGFGDPIGSFLVSSTTSSDAFRSLLDNSVKVAMSDRRILPAEARALRDAGGGNMIDPEQEHIIALDSLVIITHPSNPVKSVTVEQFADMMEGRVNNWSQLGGEDLPIQLVLPEEGQASMEIMQARFFDGGNPQQPANAVQINSGSETAAYVNANPNAVGMVGFAFQRGAQPMTVVSECGLTMTPDAFSARTGEYDLQRFLYLYTRSDTADAPTAALLEYAGSPEADEVIAKAGFIDLGVARRGQTLDGDRARQLLDPNVDAYEGGIMRQMLSQMVDYDRLSTTFRFRTGSSALDPRGLLNMQRLADYLQTQPDGTDVLFVGFTDDVGAFDSNRDLSVGRADQVMATLQEFTGGSLGNIKMSATGFGEVAPSACNTTENGRQINRRVEVWIKASDS